MDEKVYEAQAEYIKALSHPTRIRIVEYLKESERCVCEIFPYLVEEQSNVSRHLTVLRRAGILSSRKEGVSVYYSVQDENAFRVLELVFASVKKIAREKAAVLS